MWDKKDRDADSGRLDRGEGVLERGHETPATTVQDAEWDEILSMPPHSPWPPVVALLLTGMFAMLLLAHFTIAAGFLVAVRARAARLARAGGGGVSEVSRSMAAQDDPSTARVAQRRAAQPNGWWGMVLFLCAETTLFGTLPGHLLLPATSTPRSGPRRDQAPSTVAPLIATAVLDRDQRPDVPRRACGQDRCGPTCGVAGRRRAGPSGRATSRARSCSSPTT